MKRLLFVCALLEAVAVSAANVIEATVAEGVAGVTDISYEISGDAPKVVTMEVLTNGVSAGASGVRHTFGDVWKLVRPGAHKIAWRADRDLAPEVYEAGDFKVTLTAWETNCPPDYLVVDLVRTNFTYYPSVDHLVKEGDALSRVYATCFWVFRKIPAALRWFPLGNPTDAGNQRDVMLSEDYYIAIYETTDGQNHWMRDHRTGTAYPVSNSYNGWRGTSFYWPAEKHQLGGVLQAYRDATGLEVDMPTEAQWEIAARGDDFSHTLYNGTNMVTTTETVDGKSYVLAPMLDEIGWVGWNSTNETGACAVHEVGLKKPNAYGLYDVIGNFWEYCREYNWAYQTAPTVDPTCAPKADCSSSTQFVRRGGSYNQSPVNAMLVSRSVPQRDWSNDGGGSIDGSGHKENHGLRAVCPAVAVK